MEDEYILNPGAEDYYIYSLDDDDSNLPFNLSKGPYYESLEKIPFRRIIEERYHRRRDDEYNQRQTQEQSINRSPPRFNSSPINSPVQSFRSRSPSPVRSRQEFGPGEFETSNPDRINLRQWKIDRSIPLHPGGYHQMTDEGCLDLARYMDVSDLNFIDRDGEIYFCYPANVLQEYIGLYRINKPFSRITRQVERQSLDASGSAVLIKDLYAGSTLVGTFEAPRSAKGIPGQFNRLPNDIKLKIMEELDPRDLVTVCNLNMNTRQLCQDPIRSVWRKKLQQAEPNLDFRRIVDPFRYFMQHYIGGSLLTLGANRSGQLGRMIMPAKKFQDYFVGGPSSRVDDNPGSPYASRETMIDLKPKPITLEALNSRGRSEGDIELNQIAKMAAGSNFTVAVTVSGKIFEFGRTFSYGLRSGNSWIPRQIEIGSQPALAVACGESHTAILTRDGRVLTSGKNDYGQLGWSEITGNLSPQAVTKVIEVEGITDAVAIACGSDHTAVLLRDGQLITFGKNDNGQLGRETPQREYNDYGQTKMVSFDPTPVSTTNIISGFQISCGKNHTVVVLADGRVASFGANNDGQLGRVTPEDPSSNWDRKMSGDAIPTPIPEFRTAIKVSCGHHHTTVLLRDGRVATFGNNERGQLGRPVNHRDEVPQIIEGVTTATAIACGRSSTNILLKNGNVLTAGQIVRDYARPTHKLKVIPGINTAIDIAAGDEHLAILVMSRAW